MPPPAQADTVIALQVLPNNQKRLDVLKNRYDGTLDKINLTFDPFSRSYVASRPEEGGGDGSVEDQARNIARQYAEMRGAANGVGVTGGMNGLGGAGGVDGQASAGPGVAAANVVLLPAGMRKGRNLEL